jgi:tetratricopeptide (TPR) repeat protein
MKTHSALALLLGLTLWSAAQEPTPEQACLWSKWEDRIPACTKLIDSKKYSGVMLGFYYQSRADAKDHVGDAAGAMADMNRALELDPENFSAYAGRAMLRFKKDDLDGAIADADRALKIHPNAYAYNTRGLVRLRRAQLDLALSDFTAAIELEPLNSVPYLNRGRVKGQRKDPSALDDLNKAIELSPDDPDGYSNRGLVKSQQNDVAGAKADFDRALELKPDHQMALNNRGSLRMRLGDLDGAHADLTAAIALAPTDVNAYGNRALVRTQQGNFAGAMEDAKRGAELAPTRAAFHGLIADTNRSLGSLTLAHDELSIAIQLEPTAGYYHARGIVRSDLGDFAGALTDFREALKRDPARDYTWIRLWLMESRLGRRSEATDELRGIIPSRRAGGASDWAVMLEEFLVGAINEASLFQTATNGIGNTAKDHECEANFYSGWVRLVGGDTAGARERFERAVTVCRTAMVERLSAKAELNARSPLDTVTPARQLTTGPTDVTYCDLTRNPERFDKQSIRLTAFVNYAFEDFTLWDPACTPPPNSEFRAWVTFGGDLSPGVPYCCPGEGGTRTGATPYPLTKDQTFERFQRLLQTERDTVARVTAVGTLLAKSEGKTAIERATGGGGYGHFGCCSMFVIERVESFDAHARTDLDYSASAGFYDQGGCKWRSLRWELEDAFGSGSTTARGIREQIDAEAGDRAWAFADPHRVALEAARTVHGSPAKSLKLVKKSSSRHVFEWDHDHQITTVVVTRPYWLSYFARASDVVWVVTAMNTADCHK